jgi:hypothetical protein
MEYAGFTHTRWTARVSHYSRETTRPFDRLQGMGSAVQTSDQATGKAGGHTHSRDGEGIPRAVSESRPTRGLMSVPPYLSIAKDRRNQAIPPVQTGFDSFIANRHFLH